MKRHEEQNYTFTPQKISDKMNLEEGEKRLKV
jgi:hypothetical protein